MKILTISAKAQHGKDYTAKLLKEELERYGRRVLICHYADLLKYICKTFFGWDGNKDEKGRTLLQKVGTEGVRSKNPNYWVDFIKSILRFFPREWDYVIIPDTRFPNEIESLKTEYDVMCIHVVRPGFENNLTEKQRNHPSETALDDYKFDYEIINNGTLDGMRNEVKQLIDYMKQSVEKKTLIESIRDSL